MRIRIVQVRFPKPYSESPSVGFKTEVNKAGQEVDVPPPLLVLNGNGSVIGKVINYKNLPLTGRGIELEVEIEKK